MADYIHLQHGAQPWEGSGHPAHHVATYHFHDMPLIGLIRQAGVNYLFRCFVGAVESFNVWSYTLVEQWEIEQLEGSETSEEIDNLVYELTRRPGVAAIAFEGYGIIASVEVQDWSTTQAYAQPLLEALEDWVRKLQSNVESQRPRLAAIG